MFRIICSIKFNVFKNRRTQNISKSKLSLIDTTASLNEKFDRVAVVLTGFNTEKILEILKASYGSGEKQVVITYNLLKKEHGK
jgi:hypothetical protein